jgi:hypothetical protein
VHDLPNVLYEVVNESSGGGVVDRQFAEMMGMSEPPDGGDSTEWQYWVIDVVKRYEEQMGYDRHPIGMTMQFPVADQTKVNDPLFNSRADWISPGYDDEIFAKGGHPVAPGAPPSRWFDNPPANDGAKVVITDTDHYAPGKGDALWAWKAFVRGQHPILMDFGIIAGLRPSTPPAGASPYEAFEPVRYAMGDTLRYARKMELIAMEPHGELSSTGYALANPGNEYLVLQPRDADERFSVTLKAGTYTVDWYSVSTRQSKSGGEVEVAPDAPISFTSPFAGPAVVYLRARGK